MWEGGNVIRIIYEWQIIMIPYYPYILYYLFFLVIAIAIAIVIATALHIDTHALYYDSIHYK